MIRWPAFSAILLLFAGAQLAPAAPQWPHWRGPTRNGLSDETNLPLRWSTQENISWKVPLSGRSGSTPIIWGERIFVVVTEGQGIELWCLDRRTGAAMWKKSLGGGNRRTQKANMASPSPVTDGQSVWVLTGTGQLRRFDLNGNELWLRDLAREYGAFGLYHGYGSSPLLYEDAVYVQVVHGGSTSSPSYLMRVDKETGKTVWRVVRATDARGESLDAYTTPAIVRSGSGLELVVSGADCVTGHDLASGRELWRANVLNPNNSWGHRVVPSPVVMGELIFVPSKIRPVLAMRAGGRGDVTKSHLVWSVNVGSDVPSPVSDGKYLYVIRDNGILYCFDARSGQEVYGGQRLRSGTYSSSLVLADGKIYATSEDGVTSVVRAGPQFEILAENDLDGYTLSSPAISNGQIFMRTDFALWAIGQPR